mgnify:CR=1 FL=1
MKESAIERAVVAHCKARGLLCYKFSSPAHRGVPDRVILGPSGRIMFLELKAPGKHPTPLQYRELFKIGKFDFSAIWRDDAGKALWAIDTFFKPSNDWHGPDVAALE